MRFLTLSIVCVAITVAASGQMAPWPPLSPTDPSECQRFQEEVTRYFAEKRADHQKCLDDANKLSKPNPASNENRLICSQMLCQYLHDDLYPDKETEAQKEVQKCQKRVADAQVEAAEEQAAKDKAEKERLERKAIQSASTSSHAQTVVPSSHPKSGLRPVDSDAREESSRDEDDDEQSSQRRTLIDSNRRTRSIANEPSIADPYGGSSKSGDLREPSMADPYGGTELAERGNSIADPYSLEVGAETATSRVRSNIYHSGAERALEIAIKSGEQQLDADIKNAPSLLRGKKLAAYIEEAEDTKGVLSGLGNVLHWSGYAENGVSLLKADNGQDRAGGATALGLRIAKDVSTKGISTVATKLFPEAAAALSGPVGWASFVGSQVLTPTATSRDFSEIIRDNSGRTPLSAKQEALFQMWEQYHKHGASWQDSQKRELLEDTDLVYDLATAGGHGSIR